MAELGLYRVTMAHLSIRQYAKRRGLSHTAVQKALKQGRIRPTADGRIDVEQADRDWQRHTGPSKPPGFSVPDEGLRGPSFAKSRAIRELYMAKLAKLEFEQRSGKLTDRQEVEHAAFNAARTTRDRMLCIPSRVAPILATESDANRIQDILEEEIRWALVDLSESRARNQQEWPS